jgi:fructose-bisphosphate aldolase class I|tara:strand:+ start:1739 stop:2626 length:888 start_codon:yes stop_codon:yes gene_type:complete
MDDIKINKMRHAEGFIAALDQSGGSTPKALSLYGITSNSWNNDEEMFSLVHEMRTRIIKSQSFTGENVIAAILFENTMDRKVNNLPTADYLWNEKNILPILKVDKGLSDENNGIQLMNPMPELDNLLQKAKNNGIFGTKMRSVIKQYSDQGIEEIVEQQFLLAKQILSFGLIPIIEPEVDIHCPEKNTAEHKLKTCLIKSLNKLDSNSLVILKLTLPEENNLYLDCVNHEKTLRVVALSGGYSREEANKRLYNQKGMIASFSRALSEGLSVNQSDDEFNIMLEESIKQICKASRT